MSTRLCGLIAAAVLVPGREGSAGARVGSALEAVLVMTSYQLVGSSPGSALRAALGTALVVLSVAMVAAVRDLQVRTPDEDGS